MLVLGILSLVLCGLLGPVAWSMGNKIKQEAAAMGRDEPGSCKGGRICGIIATALIVLGVVGFVLIAVIGVANSSNSG